MRGTLQYRFTTARVQWPCSTDIHWACLITQSGPARYVIVVGMITTYKSALSGELLTGMYRLPKKKVAPTEPRHLIFLFILLSFFFYEDQ